MIKVALDVMGGDFSPKVGVEAANLAIEKHKNLELILFGDEEQINKYLTAQERVTVVHCSEEITGDDEPAKGVRSKKDSSMVQAITYVKDGKADAVVSSGNTGAMLTACTLILGRIKNIKRPALLAHLPSIGGEYPYFTITDVGANADCSPEYLQQFAHFGKFYNKFVLDMENPRIGLLSNGTEDGKGNELTKKTHVILKEDPELNFVGNVEGNGLLAGHADVVVSDGFTMNVALKTLEGTTSQIFKLIKNIIYEGSLKTKLGGLLIKNDLMKLASLYDDDFFGGAILMGVKAPAIITHGAADAPAMLAGVTQAMEIVESKMVDAVTEHFAASDKE